MKVDVFNMEGEKLTEQVELPAAIFEAPINVDLMHQAYVQQMANARLGTHKTKTRSEVSGGGRKPWKQKGTGRARQGSNTAPNWARGGKAHGPLPHKYAKDMPKKMKQKAFVSALSLKASESRVHVFEGLGVTEPRTRQLAGILAKAELAGARNLIVVEQPESQLLLAARNLPDTRVERVQDIHTYELLSSDNVIFTASALKMLVEARG